MLPTPPEGWHPEGGVQAGGAARGRKVGEGGGEGSRAYAYERRERETPLQAVGGGGAAIRDGGCREGGGWGRGQVQGGGATS